MNFEFSGKQFHMEVKGGAAFHLYEGGIQPENLIGHGFYDMRTAIPRWAVQLIGGNVRILLDASSMQESARELAKMAIVPEHRLLPDKVGVISIE